jgi:hypothetical protein
VEIGYVAGHVNRCDLPIRSVSPAEIALQQEATAGRLIALAQDVLVGSKVADRAGHSGKQVEVVGR